MKIIDISIPINNKTIIYPNNPSVSIEKVSDLPESSSRLSKISFGSHTGTHIDAPSHTIQYGDPIEYYSLDNFIGDCRVFDFSYLEAGSLIKISDFEKFEIKAGDRILVKTSNSLRGFDEFYEDFVALDGDCADWLAEKNISLFGIDYLSIKKRGSSDNRAHNSLLSKNIPIIEGLNLKEASAGNFQIFCPPLNISGIDGSPARAVLIANE